MTRAPAGLLAILLLGACTGGDPNTPRDSSTQRLGGTLRLASPEDPVAKVSDPAGDPATLDPQLEYEPTAFELLRCCLVRTLLSYTGQLTRDGGGELRPDLASELPQVSDDGLTWTFRLRPGLRYAPPLEDVEIRAVDFITAFERDARLAGRVAYSFWYSGIEGFDAFAAGEAESITGLEAPDDHTLVVRLTRPQGDFGHRVAMPAISPIPPHPTDPTAEFGVATGHDDGYGRFLVASGPYMFEGSGALDISAEAEDVQPVSGLDPGRRVALVRNLSWERSSDPIRPAYVDRIVLTAGGSLEDAQGLVDRDEADLVFYAGPPPQVPEEAVERYRADPDLGRVEITPRDLVYSLAMKLAIPPFDDVHVRRAANLAVDKAALIEHLGGHLIGRVATHVVPDGIEGNLLAGYDPYPPTEQGPDLARAREEMALATRYDRNGDGTCDVEACRDVPALELRPPAPLPVLGELVRSDLARIGIHLQLRVLDFDPWFEVVTDPTSHNAIDVSTPWAKDFVNASSFLTPLFHSSNVAGSFSLVGASPSQLRQWGYTVRDVPSVDSRIDQCAAIVGDAQTECWARLDQYIMEEVVPYVPLRVDHQVVLVPKRITAFSFAQLTTLPALERLAVVEEP